MALAPIQPLSLLSDERLAEVRRRFLEVGFTEQAIQHAESVAPGYFDAIRLPLVRWRLEKDATPSATLTRLFLYGATVGRSELRAALTDPLFNALFEAGWLLPEGDALRSAFRVTPFCGLWLLHDDPEAGEDAVMGPGPTTLELCRWMTSPQGKTLADIGCGAGTLALVAKKEGATWVLGTDLNARAIALAQFNARLNGLSAEFRTGSWMEPLKSQRFDVVVAQPPYVARPPKVNAVTFLHGGAMGDEMAMHLISLLKDALDPRTGMAHVMFDSALRKEPLAQRVRTALGDAALDAVLLTTRGASADLHSLAYATVEAPKLDASYEACVRRYREHLESLQVSEFIHTLLTLRACAVPRGRFTVSLPIRSFQVEPSPRELTGLLTTLELAASPDRELLRATLQLRPGLTWVEERALPDSSLPPRFKVVFPKGTVGSDHEVAENAYVLFGAFCQPQTVQFAVAHYAQACGASPEEVSQEVLAFVRQALGRGVLCGPG